MTSNSTYGSFYKNESENNKPAVPPLAMKTLSDKEMALKIQRQEYLSPESPLSPLGQSKSYLKPTLGRLVAQEPISDFCAPKFEPTGQIIKSARRVAARELLNENLEKFGFVETKVSSDGNCQFRSIAWYVFGTDDKFGVIRERVIKHMEEHPTLYSDFIEGGIKGYQKYLEKMSRDMEWGDHLTLQASSDLFGFKIQIVTSHALTDDKKTAVPDASAMGGTILVIQSRDEQGNRCPHVKEIWLSFCEEHGAEHYNPITKRRAVSTPRP
eukprot:TRINITY_DN13713_c0_g1_i1.p1 TRINITY_DN13713_c0_g1~~TRINITY_DN13713_c0_g1_i1.p1  ORF type:complete len:269 (+),score=38.26 TRINITY_DN13713_c0_g1_i1:40-846(+)